MPFCARADAEYLPQLESLILQDSRVSMCPEGFAAVRSEQLSARGIKSPSSKLTYV